MAHHKSAKKRIRQNAVRRLKNRYYGKTTRNAVRKLREIEDKKEAEEHLPKVVSMIDRMVRMNQFHKNKAANLKSKLTRYVNNL